MLPILCFVQLHFISAFAFADIHSDLISHIEKAEKKLSQTESKISRERQVFAQELNLLEKEVLSLRQQTAIARRAADEQTLSISQLEERLNAWRQQNIYQQNLLNRFVQQHGNDAASKAEQRNSINSVVAISEHLQNQFYPKWRSAEVVLPNGEIQTQPVLSVGPVNWFTLNEQAGIASKDKSGQFVGEVMLDGSAATSISTLEMNSTGTIVFDPTLNRALAREQHSESAFEHVQKGGLWAVPIIAFAIFALGIALLKVLQLVRLPKIIRYTPTAVRSALTDGQSPLRTRIGGMQKQLLDVALMCKNDRERDDQLFMQLQDNKNVLDRWIGAIAITAAVSPLLGLLGTVSGMIETFKMMTLFGSGDPEVVSGGIAQALVTTELGLVVAIPALILNAILSRKARNYYNELESFAIAISKTETLEDIEGETNPPIPSPPKEVSLPPSEGVPA
jgi:biopolymer transport protein ExbB